MTLKNTICAIRARILQYASLFFFFIFLSIVAFLLEKYGFPVSCFGLTCGMSYSALSVYFYANLVRLLSGRKDQALGVVLLLCCKLTLLAWFLLSVSALGTLWIYSSLAGFLCILPAALLSGNRSQVTTYY